MRILIPLDGSTLSEQALATAVRLAKTMQPTVDVFILKVIPYSIIDTGVIGPYAGVGMVTPTPEMTRDGTHEAATDYLRMVSELPIWQGIPIQTVVEVGELSKPSASICAVAQREQIDLIIMTSHRRTGFEKWMLGSVAEMVARDARMPVLIVRSEEDTFPDDGRFLPLTILVPLDGTPLSETAIPAAAMIAQPLHGTITLVSILLGTPDPTSLAAHHAHIYLTAVQDRLRHEGLTVTYTLGWGDPAEQIASKAQIHHADMIAIATHARMPLAQLTQGSVAFAVLHQLTIPMLFVHSTDDNDTDRPTNTGH